MSGVLPTLLTLSPLTKGSRGPEDHTDTGVGGFAASHPVTALTLGSSHVDADPEQKEEDPKAHEERGHQGDEELFVDVPSVLGGGDLVTGKMVKEK